MRRKFHTAETSSLLDPVWRPTTYTHMRALSQRFLAGLRRFKSSSLHCWEADVRETISSVSIATLTECSARSSLLLASRRAAVSWMRFGLERTLAMLPVLEGVLRYYFLFSLSLSLALSSLSAAEQIEKWSTKKAAEVAAFDESREARNHTSANRLINPLNLHCKPVVPLALASEKKTLWMPLTHERMIHGDYPHEGGRRERAGTCALFR